jgi:outer membrane protein TolC
MLKHLVRAALLGLHPQSIIPTFAKIPRKGGGTFVRGLSVGLLFGIASAGTCQAQCSAVASTPQYASDCAARAIPENKIAAIDAAHSYSLAELVDIAEQNNPTTRIAWERAKQMNGMSGRPVSRASKKPRRSATRFSMRSKSPSAFRIRRRAAPGSPS